MSSTSDDTVSVRVKSEPEDAAESALLSAQKEARVKKEADGDSEAAEDGEGREISHQQLMARFQSGLAEIIQHDPLLRDLPSEITLEEINSQIALEYGQAMTVNVSRADGIILPIVVVQNATVLDLKKAIRRHFSLRHSRQGGTKHIGWRYVWRSYWLVYEGQKMTEDNKTLKDYGIRNKCEVSFMKRLRDKTP